MGSMQDAIRAAMEQDTTPPPRVKAIPTARDFMATQLVKFGPDQSVREVMRSLLKHRISGGPVVDEHGRLLGTISEGDCLKVLTCGIYDGDPVDVGRPVRELMAPVGHTIEPSTDIYAIAHILVDATLRRVPVVEAGRVVGQVSRRDILRAIQTMS